MTINTRLIMTATTISFASLLAGCGPTFDPASLIESTRVVGARTEVAGAPTRATPAPGETVDVTWLVAWPGATPPLAWVFAVCPPGMIRGATGLGCAGPPLAVFEGNTEPPHLSIPVPAADAFGSARSLVLYGQLCAGPGSMPAFDARSGATPTCSGGGGTTVSLDVSLQLRTDDANHNPTADRAFTLDGQEWPAHPTSDDPCAVGPRVPAASKDHIIGNTTEGSDREPYAVVTGVPPVATTGRERLRISQFTTAGKLTSQFAFVEATDTAAATTVDVAWEAPVAADVPAAGMAVTFTFVTRDNRGGTDWTTRALCVER